MKLSHRKRAENKEDFAIDDGLHRKRTNSNPTSIPEYFSGQSILITGGTGFMGKVLVEKILRCCTDVKKIYLMMRPKRHGTIEKRWEEITKLLLFDILRSTNAHSLKKVQPVQGDISKEYLGLSQEGAQILTENVNIIYHAAAMIQFTDNLYELLVENTKATYTILNVAKSIKNIELFVYVSTAFSNMNLPCHEAEERVLPACQDWRVILRMLEENPLSLTALKEKLMCGHPNPYTWSKSLAEQIVNEHRANIPCIIVRPSIVWPTLKEPFPGWADILCGQIGISIPVGLGMMRLVYSRDESYQDYVPVDIAVNAMLVAAWKKNKETQKGCIDVYNCGVAKEVPVTSYDLKKNCKNVIKELPSKNIIWAYHVLSTTNDHIFYLLFILLQVIPGAIMDLGLLLTGNKPMVLNLTKKASKVTRLYKRFSSSQLVFPNDNFKELDKYLSEEDKKFFSVNVGGVTQLDLVRIGMKAALKYYLKEDLSEASLRKNRRRLFWLEVLDKCLIYTIYALAAWLLFHFMASFEIFRNMSNITYKALWD